MRLIFRIAKVYFDENENWVLGDLLNLIYNFNRETTKRKHFSIFFTSIGKQNKWEIINGRAAKFRWLALFKQLKIFKNLILKLSSKTSQKSHFSTRDFIFSRYPVALNSTQGRHGGEDVLILANGPMAHLFQGIRMQTYIAAVMQYATCTGKYQNACELKESSNRVTTDAIIPTSTSLFIFSCVFVHQMLLFK